MKRLVPNLTRRGVRHFLYFLQTNLKYDINQIASDVLVQNAFYQVDIHKIKSILKSEKIVFFDIGARNGINKNLNKYKDILDIYLSDADETESSALESKGVNVIKKGISRKNQDEIDLYLCKKPAVSSVLKPNGRFLSFYTQGNNDRFKVIRKTKINTTNVSSIFKHRSSLDLLKIDVQGYELEVIKGFGEVRPLLIETEISFLPLYENSTTFFELGKELYDMGYILFHTTYGSRKVSNTHINQLPIHGDAWFIPDWTRKKGLNIIKDRMTKLEALMFIYGMEDIFNYATSEIQSNKQNPVSHTRDS